MIKEIEGVVSKCVACQSLASFPSPKYQSWSEPENVQSRLHMDFAGPFWNDKWLIIVDAKSKYPIVKKMNNDTSANNKALEEIFDIFGSCDTIVTDNGLPFNSNQMLRFYNRYSTEHITAPLSSSV
ncbi:unnamed protein product [Anisakis simplex]|uniref:Integrase catalytic domain-containing protein n=1 Tax=Anisakis simplex TaxID=6269 RepID=A0A0M3IYY4_ANISI|nr:unnamed protein product [Anisakis simplex]